MTLLTIGDKDVKDETEPESEKLTWTKIQKKDTDNTSISWDFIFNNITLTNL